jgi:trans-aconitate methyltransferase
LDVGGGASTLVDHLLAAGHTDVSVLDIEPAALAKSRARLGAAASQVEWIAADVTEFRPSRRYALWHDRAVFHFLVDPGARDRYLDVLRQALRGGGDVILAGFGPQGPTRCSGLAVRRYSAEDLGALLGESFALRQSFLDAHTTPAGSSQQFLYGWWRAEARHALEAAGPRS